MNSISQKLDIAQKFLKFFQKIIILNHKLFVDYAVFNCDKKDFFIVSLFFYKKDFPTFYQFSLEKPEFINTLIKSFVMVVVYLNKYPII